MSFSQGSWRPPPRLPLRARERDTRGLTDLGGARPSAGRARSRPRPAPAYLRVPTARPPAAAAGAAAAAGHGGRAPGPLWPPLPPGVGGPTWATGPGHISAGGPQRPAPSSRCLPRIPGPSAGAARGAVCGRSPGRRYPGCAPPASRRSPAGCQREGRDPAISGPQPRSSESLNEFPRPRPARSLV